jgi:phosphoglycerate dehydrogenase-like enzyme
MISIALCAPYGSANGVFAERHLARLAELGNFIDARFLEKSDEVLDKLAEADFLVSTWGIPRLDEAFLDKAPHLRGIFYAAGSIKHFVTPAMFSRGIVISSAAPANAIPVAEYTIAVITLSAKLFWQTMRRQRGVTSDTPAILGNYRRTVGIIAASMVGRNVIRLLRNYAMEVLLYDPFVSEEEAGKLGVLKVELPELMSRSDFVSLHAPNLPSLRHMINADLLKRMKDGATFINTARGALVDEEALLAELKSGRIQAVLDVTDPEPPVDGSPLYTLTNVIYTPHIAGSVGQECQRQADFAIDELERFIKGEPLQNSVKQESLGFLA